MSSAAPAAPLSDGPPTERVRLPGGEVLDLHPMRGDDADALVAFHHQLSRETTYRRFFSPHPELSPKELAHFTQVDHLDREAIVATSEGHIVGVGRYDRRAGTSEAEVAFVVADAWQRKGIGRLLLDRIIRAAQARGLARLTAETLCTNRPMLATFRAAGLPMTTTMSGGVVHVVLELG